MRKNEIKGSEPFIIKVVIITMSLIYILGPMHLEVKELLHTITHTLEMPDSVLSHQNRFETVKTHTSKQHKTAEVQHNHELIAFAEKILEEFAGSNQSKDVPAKMYKVDKHIKIHEEIGFKTEYAVSNVTKPNFEEIEKNICKGYPNGFKEPPQV